MKHFFAVLICGILFGTSVSSNAQSFTVLHDTVYITSGGVATIPDSIYTVSGITAEWKVIDTDFPSDWKVNAGFCDPMACYNMITLYPSGTTPVTMFGSGYGTSSSENILLYDNDLTLATPGCHYVQVRMNNQAIPTDTAIITYLVCKTGASQVAAITSSGEDEITFYPNPAIGTLNVVYSEMLGVKNIAIYSVIGRQMNIYSTTDNKGAMLNIDNIPSGIYYLRLLNSAGGVIATRRFMKQ